MVYGWTANNNSQTSLSSRFKVFTKSSQAEFIKAKPIIKKEENVF